MFFDELELIEMGFNFYEKTLKNKKVRFDRTVLTLDFWEKIAMNASDPSNVKSIWRDLL